MSTGINQKILLYRLLDGRSYQFSELCAYTAQQLLKIKTLSERRRNNASEYLANSSGRGNFESIINTGLVRLLSRNLIIRISSGLYQINTNEKDKVISEIVYSPNLKGIVFCDFVKCTQFLENGKFCKHHHNLVCEFGEALAIKIDQKKICSIKDCEDTVHCSGLCHRHYDQLRLKGKLLKKGEDRPRKKPVIADHYSIVGPVERILSISVFPGQLFPNAGDRIKVDQKEITINRILGVTTNPRDNSIIVKITSATMI